MMLRVSVALCTYNGERFLQEQLDSLSSQTVSPYEIVICDDRSQDSSFEILARFQANSSIPVRLAQNADNLGSTANFNRAISLCRGDVIALCDQDDVWHRRKLESQVRVLSGQADAGGVFCDGELIDEKGDAMDRSLWDSLGFTRQMRQQVAGGFASRALARQNFVTGATLLFRTELRSCFGEIPHGWVHDNWLAWMIVTHSKLVMMPDQLISYRIHKNNQIGVNLTSPIALLTSRDRRTAILRHRADLSRMQSLHERLSTGSFALEIEVRRLVEERISFVESRIRLLEESRSSRSLQVLRKTEQYCRFTNGWRSIIGDLLM